MSHLERHTEQISPEDQDVFVRYADIFRDVLASHDPAELNSVRADPDAIEILMDCVASGALNETEFQQITGFPA